MATRQRVKIWTSLGLLAAKEMGRSTPLRVNCLQLTSHMRLTIQHQPPPRVAKLLRSLGGNVPQDLTALMEIGHKTFLV